jgi:hypothetical protein
LLYACRLLHRERSERISLLPEEDVWFATADFLGRLRNIKDSRWIVDSARVKSGFISGVTICANTNSLLDFKKFLGSGPYKTSF